MTMQMMKTTARTGPTTQMSPSPASRGWGSESGAITGSVYGLATYIFYDTHKSPHAHKHTRTHTHAHTHAQQ